MKPNIPSFAVLSIGLVFFSACDKIGNSPKTIYDTVTVTKTDTLVLPPSSDTPNVTNGLVLYLPFTDGSYADSSGLNNQVTALNGATLGYDMHGYAQSAFSEDGNGAVLTVANNGSYSVDSAFSVSLDFMIRSYPYYSGDGNYSGLQDLLSIVNFSNATGATFAIGFVDPYAPTSFAFDVNADTSANTCGSLGGGDPSLPWDTASSFTPQLGAWYNAICIFNKGIGNIYINGQLVSSKKIGASTVPFCQDAVFVVGSWWNSTEPVNGEIDEVRMYNKALNAQQIAWLSRNFQIHSNGQKPGLKRGRASAIN